MTYIIRCPDGTRWKVRQARSLKAALNEIGHAKATGSVGSISFSRIPWTEREYVVADVVQVHSDNTERQVYEAVR